MRFPSFAQILRVVVGQDELAHEIEQQRIEHLEAVRVVHEVPEQHVVLEEHVVVVPAVDEKEAVLQQIVRLAKILAEERAPRFRDRAFFHLAPDSADRVAHLANHVLSVGLGFGNLRAHHVRLLAVLEKLAAPANPVLALHQNARKLVAHFLADVLQQRKLMQNVGFDRLLKFRAGQRFLQNFGQHAAEGGVLRRAARLLAILAVGQRQVDRLPNQIEKILAAKFEELGAQIDVIMDVVDAERQLLEPDFGGVGLELHPGWMGGRWRSADFRHSPGL